jgi:hypothetical protein
VCRRLIKLCPKCRQPNRAFANFCSACSTPLPDSDEDWSAFKGGPRRLGYNPAVQAGLFGDLTIREILELRLEDRCRTILSWDHHVIAISQKGVMDIVEIGTGALPLRLTVDGPVTCEPCISRGTLFLGAPGRVTAYPLGALTLHPPRLEPRWGISLPGTPIQALTVLEDSLYVTVIRPDQKNEILSLGQIHGNRPSTPKSLFTARRLGWMAAEPSSRSVVFLSEEGGDLWLHCADHSRGDHPGLTSRRLLQTPRPFADNVPIAVLEDKLFGVFGEADPLCRIDFQDGSFDQVLRDDTKIFSMSGLRDGIHIDSAGIFFLGPNISDALNPFERVKCPPVILGDCAAAIGLQDGRIRVYDLHNPPRHEVLRLANEPDEITALASFRTYLAAGNAGGIVKVFELTV